MNLWGRKCSPHPTPPPSWLLPYVVIFDGRFALSGFPSGSDGKSSVCNAGDPGSIPELGRSPGEGNGSPLQECSCLENLMDRGAW